MTFFVVLFLCFPAITYGQNPSLQWTEVGKGTIEHAGGWDEETKTGNFSSVYFVRGVVGGGDVSSRLVAHACIDGDWIEDPWNIHVEPLSEFDSSETRSFVIQIPGAALTDSLEIWLSLAANDAILYTFNSWVLARSERGLSYYEGRPLPAATNLKIARNRIRSNAKPAAWLIPEVRHVVPKGQEPPRKAR